MKKYLATAIIASTLGFTTSAFAGNSSAGSSSVFNTGSGNPFGDVLARYAQTATIKQRDAEANKMAKRLGLPRAGFSTRNIIRPRYRVILAAGFPLGHEGVFTVECYSAKTGEPMPVMVWATVNGRNIDLEKPWAYTSVTVRGKRFPGLTRVKAACGGDHGGDDAIVHSNIR